MKMRLSVVVPVFNEASTIREILRQVRAVGLADEIIVVDRASPAGRLTPGAPGAVE